MGDISLKLEQKIKLSQIQRLTIQMMPLKGQELDDFLYEQVMENPLLDIRYPDVRSSGAGSGEKPIHNLQSRGDSLEDLLMKELRLQSVPKKVMMAAGLVIQSLDERGFVAAALDELGAEYGLSPADMQEGLRLVQTFDPPGVGASSIQEALLIQTRRRHDAPPEAERLLSCHYDDFLHGRWQKLEAEMNISSRTLQRIRAFLKTLSLQPAASVSEAAEYVRADVEIADDGGTLSVHLLEDVPSVFFRDDLYETYGADGDKEVQTFIRRAKRQFLDLQTALAYRRRSILLVMQHIAAVQEKYFLEGKSLRPLTQKDIAAAVGLSTAAVSRVCRGRYALFRQKVYAVQSFLAQGYRHDGYEGGCISDQAIMEEMAALIRSEDWRSPWSDQELAQHFSRMNIRIARRTITKFRLKMNIPNSRIRKRLKCPSVAR